MAWDLDLLFETTTCRLRSVVVDVFIKLNTVASIEQSRPASLHDETFAMFLDCNLNSQELNHKSHYEKAHCASTRLRSSIFRLLSPE